MAACLACSQDSSLLTYDAFGFCHHCSPQHASAVAEAVNGVIAAATERTKAKKPEDQLEALSESLAHCAVLERYPRLSIDGVEPSRLRADIEATRTAVVEQAIRDFWFEARERAKDAGSYKVAFKSYAKAVKGLQDLMDYVDDVTTLEKAVVVLRAERDALVFETICRSAQLAEEQGKKAAARNLYIAAVFELRKDGTPDSYQSDHIAFAEQQIERLGGRPTSRATP